MLLFLLSFHGEQSSVLQTLTVGSMHYAISVSKLHTARW